MRKHSQHTEAARSNAIAQLAKVYDESTKRYFDAQRSISAAALKSQCALLDAAGQMLVAGHRVVTRNIEQLTDKRNGSAHVRKSS